MTFDEEVRESLLRLNAEAMAANLLLSSLCRVLAMNVQRSSIEQAFDDADVILEAISFEDSGPAQGDQITRAAEILERLRIVAMSEHRE